MDRIIIGLVEKVTIYGKRDLKKKVKAKIDTGATKSSIDAKLAAALQLGPILATKLVKSAHGNTLRPVVSAKVKIRDIEVTSELTIADRAHMKYPLLIGQNMLKHHFLIDPSKK